MERHGSASEQNAEVGSARRAMVRTIEVEIGRHGGGLGVSELDPRVRDAMLRVPRERFVPPSERTFA
jgi:hypothetical protein